LQLLGGTVSYLSVSVTLGLGSGSLKCSAVELPSQNTLMRKVKRAGGVMLHRLVLCQPGILLCYRNPQLPVEGSLRLVPLVRRWLPSAGTWTL